MRTSFWIRSPMNLLGFTAVCGSLSLGACTNDTRLSQMTAPIPRPEVPLAAGRHLTDAEIDALIMSHDTAFARKIRNAERLRPSKMLVDDGSGGSTSDPSNTTGSDASSQVTASGGAAGSTVTVLDLGATIWDVPMASWASETKVTSGFARRVFLQTQGDYSQIWPGQTEYYLRRFSGVCGEALTDLFRQDCKLGDIYTDVSCYPSTTGHIFAQSQHGATFGIFSSNTVTVRPTTSYSPCKDATIGDSGGGGDCNDYALVDDPSGYPSSDCSDPTGTGDPTSDPTTSDPNSTTGDLQYLCDELLLDPGCYDVYVDGDYNSTICC